jgi:membrane-associated protein
VAGALLWVGSLLGAGYTLGRLEFVQRHFEKFVIGIVLLSLMPIVLEWVKARAAARTGAR